GAVGNAAPIIDDPDFELVVTVGKFNADGQGVAELVAVLDGVDAGLGDGGLQVFDTVIGKAHELGHAGGGAHGDFLEAKFGREIYLYGASISHELTNSL